MDIGAVDRAARMIHETLTVISNSVEPGCTTAELAHSAVSYLMERGADPGVIVRISPENVVWHGLPGARVLKPGEIATLDIACSVRGWWADAALTFGIGRLDEKRKKLLRDALEGMKIVVSKMQAGATGEKTAEALADFCGTQGISLVSEGAGHGIGRGLHLPPSITYDGRRHLPLTAGSIYSAEPVFTTGSGNIVMADDGSTVSADGEPSAHFEVTVLLVEHGPQVLGAPAWLDRMPS